MSTVVFETWLADFEKHLFSRRPVDATFAGKYEYNHLLTDVSREGLQLVLNEIKSLLSRSEKIDTKSLNRYQKIDFDLIRGFLNIQLWERESGYIFNINPTTYSGEAVFSLVSLFISDFRAASQKQEALEARLAAIPGFFTSAMENLTGSMEGWIERSINECTGGINFLTDGIFVLQRDEGLKVNAELVDSALAAFRKFKTFLERELQRIPSENASCGEDVFRNIILWAHEMDMDPLEYADYAEGIIAECDRSLEEGAAIFGASSAEEVLARLSDSHPNVNEYQSTYAQLWEKSYELNRREDLVTWPEYPIEYHPIPVWARNVQPFTYFLFYRCPPRYFSPKVYRYHIIPVEKSMPEDQQERLLRSNNHFVIKTNHVLHHGGIGHHVQNAHALRAKNLTGRVSLTDGSSRLLMACSGTLCEGWACYISSLAGDRGFLNEMEQYAEIASRRRMAARAVVDVRLHCGVYTLEEAALYYMEKAQMPEASARSEAVKNSMFPGGAIMYLYGTEGIKSLREEMKIKTGKAFNLRRFHDEFLSYGGIPVARIAEEMRKTFSST